MGKFDPIYGASYIDELCADVPADLLAVPITKDEYAELVRIRKSNDYPMADTVQWHNWRNLMCRFQFQYPATLEREAWHEAGHVVVAYRLGWKPEAIVRNPGGWTQALIYKPCLPPMLPMLDWAAVQVSGYLAEARATLEPTDPTHEVAEVAKEFGAFERGSGRHATVWDRIRYVERAEARAHAILNDYWAGVATVAARVLKSLPVPQTAILEALKGVEPGTPPC